MGALSFSMTDNGTAFGLFPDLLWTQTTSSQISYNLIVCNHDSLGCCTDIVL